MRYNFDEVINRIHSAKYDERLKKFGSSDVIPLWVADMDFKTAQPIIDAMIKKANHGIFGYVSRPKEYFNAFISWQKKHNNWEVKEEFLSYCIGIVPALGALIQQYSKQNDKILVQAPVYTGFYEILQNNNRDILESKFKIHDGEYELDLVDFEEKLQQKPKFFILCNPHNPLGKVWSKKELKSMGDLCVKYGVLIVSDEIHSDLTLWDNVHVSMASISESIAKNTITCTSTGKAFNLAGLQSATIAFNNVEGKERFDTFWEKLEVHRNNPFNLVATIAAYEEGEEYLEQLKAYLQDNIKYVHEYFKKHIPKIKANLPQASYLIWLDCAELGFKTQKELDEFMVKKAKIGLNSGSSFQIGLVGFMRMNVAYPRSVLEKALKQLENAVNSI